MNEPKSYRAIMLSSTFTDLERHRVEVIEAIDKLGYLAKVMERSGARADVDVIESSLNMVRDSVAYIGVISLKYGQTPIDPARNPDELSITELEFNEAMRLDRPILLFIMGEDHLLRKADFETDPNKRKKLDAFRERAKRMREGSEVHRVYATFESLEQFAPDAATDIGNLVRHLERSQEPAKQEVDRKPHRALSNIPFGVPLHFLGRDGELAAIEQALKCNQGRVAITALHGLRGVGKSTLAVAFADLNASHYRATWWIRAETESTMRADLVGLGVRLGWIAADEKEEPAISVVMQKLRDEGDSILLVYDNARNAGEIRPYMPRGGTAHVIVTSNAPDWGAVAVPVKIEVWPCEIGADYLMARTASDSERESALALSEALGGLPLAHEQAAAYCERIGISFLEYLVRFNAAPAKLLDTEKDAPAEYRDRMTVSKTFALAIEEAAKLHPAAEPLIFYAAHLAAEPIPIFLFTDARECFGEPLTFLLVDDGLDESIAALRAFALVDRKVVADERDPSIATDCIHLHRLVRQVAFIKYRTGTMSVEGELIHAVAATFPSGTARDPSMWPRARRLDALAMALVAEGDALPENCHVAAAYLLDKLKSYRLDVLAEFSQARVLSERALSLYEQSCGPEDPGITLFANNLGQVLSTQGEYAAARQCYERALEVSERAFGPDNPSSASPLSNIGLLLVEQGELAAARPYIERALAIIEKHNLGDEEVARCLNNLGGLLSLMSDFAAARLYYERSLAIREKICGPNHPDTALCLNNLAYLLYQQRDLESAKTYYERALAIFEKVFGASHPDTAMGLNNVGGVLQAQGHFEEALELLERALAIREEVYGLEHPLTALSVNNVGHLLHVQGNLSAAQPYYERALAARMKEFGLHHPDVAISLNNLGNLLYQQGDADAGRRCLEQALAIREAIFGSNHLDTAISLNVLGGMLLSHGDYVAACRYLERALAIFVEAVGMFDALTKRAATNLAAALERLDQRKRANLLRKKFDI